MLKYLMFQHFQINRRRYKRGGRGGKSKLSSNYQGKQYHTAVGRGVTIDKMYTKIDSLPEKVKNDKLVTETLSQIEKVKNNPNATVTMYRATIGDTINQNDWVFLSEKQAEKWTKTSFGTPKVGVKVIKQKVKASRVDWTGKNLEFVYLGK